MAFNFPIRRQPLRVTLETGSTISARSKRLQSDLHDINSSNSIKRCKCRKTTQTHVRGTSQRVQSSLTGLTALRSTGSTSDHLFATSLIAANTICPPAMAALRASQATRRTIIYVIARSRAHRKQREIAGSEPQKPDRSIKQCGTTLKLINLAASSNRPKWNLEHFQVGSVGGSFNYYTMLVFSFSFSSSFFFVLLLLFLFLCHLFGLLRRCSCFI